MESGSGSSISIASGSNPDPGFWWPKTKEKIQLTIFYISFLIKKFNLLMSKSYRRKRKHPALQKMKLSNFFMIHNTALKLSYILLLPIFVSTMNECQVKKSTENTWRIEWKSYNVRYILPAGWPCHMAYKLSSELPGLCILVTWNLKCMY